MENLHKGESPKVSTERNVVQFEVANFVCETEVMLINLQVSLLPEPASGANAQAENLRI